MADRSDADIETRLKSLEEQVFPPRSQTPEEGSLRLGALNTEVNERTGVSGTVDINVADKASYSISATGDVTISLSNTPDDPAGHQLLIYLEGDTVYGVSWPGDVVWDGGDAPTSFDAGGLEVALVTDDGGDEWRGRVTGENFA
jgi:hypothetical protein